jgi:serine/threonine protein kinase
MDTDLVGQTISHYRIVEKLGQGGMGVVYRGIDLMLDRSVAVKVLPAGKAEDLEPRKRFFQEAKAASALNHPNIVTIHEIGHDRGVDYIAMEFITGSTLFSLLGPGGMPVPDVLKYAVQIADACSAAHAAGIVHRDLKPANIMVNERGLVKVLDFGLAKRTEPAAGEGETQTIDALTLQGCVVGTAAYMSPEQAEGKKLDRRSDIFAFGAILYELLTGRRAFHGETPISTLLAVMSKEPEIISSVRGDIPAQLDQLIARCLSKSPEQRWQHMEDLKLALEEVRQGIQSGTSSRPMSAMTTQILPAHAVRLALHSRRNLAIAASVVLMAALASWWWFAHSRASSAQPIRPPVLRRLTSDTGLTAYPALSPDGKFVAYASDRGGSDNLHIWLQQVSGGDAIRLTDLAADDYDPSFSPDGGRIAFRSEREGGGIYVVSTLGGSPRMIAPNGRRPRFSPDGTRILYWVGGDFGKIFIVDANNGATQPFQPGFFNARYPVWSPDGKFILFAGDREPNLRYETDWWVAPVDGGPAVKTSIVSAIRGRGLLSASATHDPAAWFGPQQEILFVARSGDTTNLWKIAIAPGTWKPAGPPRQITFGTATEIHPSPLLGSDGRLRAVFSSLTQTVDLWSLPLDASRGKVLGEMRQVTRGINSATQVSISADGKRMVYLADRSGNPDLAVKDFETGAETSFATSAVEWTPMINTEGSGILYAINERGKVSQVFRSSIDSGGRLSVAEKICDDCGFVTGWSSDGRTLLYSQPAPQRTRSYDLRTGQSFELLRHPSYSIWGGRFSPDDRWVLFNVTTSPIHSRIYIAPFGAGPVPPEQWIAVTDGKSWDDKPRWSPDGDLVYFISQRDGFRCIWYQRLDPATKQPRGSPSPIYHLHRARRSMMNVSLGPLSIAVARDKVVFSLGELTGNIWLATWDPQR